MRSNTKEFYRNLNFLLLFSAIIILDQATKYLVQSLTHNVVCNLGIAFGFGDSGVILPVLGLLVIAWFLFEKKSFFTQAGLILIASGGVSNIIDRIVYHCVRDFISIHNFPVFNFADVMITLGILTIIGNLTLGKEDKSV